MPERFGSSLGPSGIRARPLSDEGESHVQDLPAKAGRRRRDRTRFVDAVRELTGLTANSTSLEALPKSLLDRAVPSPGDLLKSFACNLQVRTTNALRRHSAGIVEGGTWTFRRLLEIRGVGAFCLIDILRALAGSNSREK